MLPFSSGVQAQHPQMLKVGKLPDIGNGLKVQGEEDDDANNSNNNNNNDNNEISAFY